MFSALKRLYGLRRAKSRSRDRNTARLFAAAAVYNMRRAWAALVAPGRDAATPVSRYELLELLASSRFVNLGWFVDLQAMGRDNLLRELVTLQAVSLMLDWRRYRLDERRGAIDATGLALATERMRLLPGLANPAAGAN